MSQGRFENTLVETSGRLVIANWGKLGYKSQTLPDGVLSFGVCGNMESVTLLHPKGLT